MKTIKQITKNGYTLTHEWYFDDFGLKRNAFNLFHIESRTNYPFLGKPRTTNYNRNAQIEGDDVSPFTDKEYEEMLREQTTERAINLFKEMAGISEPYGLFEPYLWQDKIGDSLWHCEIRSCDAVLGKGEAETMEDAIYKCHRDFNKDF